MKSHHFAYPNKTNFIDHALMYAEIVEWIEDVVIAQEHAATWSAVSDCIYITIEDDNDATMFALKFGRGRHYESV